MKFHQPHRVKSAYPPRLSRLGIGALFVVAIMFIMFLTPTVGEGLLPGGMEPAQFPPAINPQPDASHPVPNEQEAKAVSLETATADRKRQLGEQSAALLKLAMDLKIEVDTTSKDTLSINVIRKADEIERLAHEVKQRMKLTVGPG
jgi:hypothetical protein